LIFKRILIKFAKHMDITTDILAIYFDKFNKAYFDGKLPVPRFAVTNSRTILGQFICTRERRKILRPSVCTGFTIKVSRYYDITERDYHNILLHEMIHYHIAYHGMRDTSPHGVLFKRMMNTLNSHGWHITVSTNTRQWAVAEANRKAQYNVLTLTATDGRQFVSVVNPSYIAHVDSIAAQSPMIKSRQWYVSANDYFASFPLTRSLRGRRVSRSEMERIMAMLE